VGSRRRSSSGGPRAGRRAEGSLLREDAIRAGRRLAKGAAREALAELTLHAANGKVTLPYGARDEAHNNAMVLKREIDDTLGQGDAAA
jgi:hypothetical protein